MPKDKHSRNEKRIKQIRAELATHNRRIDRLRSGADRRNRTGPSTAMQLMIAVPSLFIALMFGIMLIFTQSTTQITGMPTIMDGPGENLTEYRTILNTYNGTEENITLEIIGNITRMIPGESVIDQIEFYGLKIDNETISLGIADVNVTRSAQAYAIDPTMVNFTEATVTVTAQGRKLYKCVDWDFTDQECDRTWRYLTDLTPGEAYNFTLTPDDPGFIEMMRADCVAEDLSAASGIWDVACDNEYPGDALLYDDDMYEMHMIGKQNSTGNISAYWAGIWMNYTNTNVTDCFKVDKVELCYKWWSDSARVSSCEISVDAEGGANHTIVNASCPDTSEPSNVTCVDVTTLEDWTCDSFFGGTGAIVQSEISHNGTGEDGEYNVTWDVLYFNVNYTDTTAPVDVSIIKPPELTTRPDVNVTYVIEMQQTGNASENYTLTVTNHDSADLAMLNQTWLVMNDSGAVELTFSNSGQGSFTVEVNVTSDADARITDSINITTRVTNVSVYGIDIRHDGEKKTDERTNATYMIKVTNTGNTPENITINITSSDADTAVLNQTRGIHLPASSARYIELTVGDNTPGEYTVQVNAAVQNGTENAVVDVKTTVLDTTPPKSISEINDIARGYTWIEWNWINPADADFNHTDVWIEGEFRDHVYAPSNSYNATDLSEDRAYSIETRTADDEGNVNMTLVTHTAMTDSEEILAGVPYAKPKVKAVEKKGITQPIITYRGGEDKPDDSITNYKITPQTPVKDIAEVKSKPEIPQTTPTRYTDSQQEEIDSTESIEIEQTAKENLMNTTNVLLLILVVLNTVLITYSHWQSKKE